ncbi:MAG: O-antigen ligase family protein [Pirellulales bacterium]|nr:O-antigen ligase family protein [Pirellulales bacterium]
MKGLIFTLMLTAGGAVGSLFDPFLGLLVYVSFAIIKPESMWFYSVPLGGNYSRIVALALLAGWAIHGFGNWDFGRGNRVVKIFVGFLIWAMLSAVLAPDQSLAWVFIREMAKIVLPFVAGVTLLTSVARLKQLAWTIVLSQGFVALELNRAYYNGFNQMQEIGFAGLDNNSVAIAMVTGFGLACFLGIFAESIWLRGIALVLAVLMAHSVMFAFSRGGMLGLISIGVVSFVLFVREPKHLVYAVVILLFMLRLAGPEVRERFSTAFVEKEQRDSSAATRIEQWGYCWDTMLTHPLFGVGPDHWMQTSAKYSEGKRMEAHSLWFQTGAELGFIGGGLLVAFYAVAIVNLWPIARSWRSQGTWSESGLRYLAGGVIAGLMGFCVSGSFVTLEGLEIPYYTVLLGAGIIKLAGRTADQPTWRPAATVGTRWAIPA